jgi:glycosyltransferase involved in cell wall biosynthesis
VNEIEEWNADAVLVYGWSFKSHLKCLRYFHKRIAVFFRGDSIERQKTGIKSFGRKFVLKWVYRHVDKAFYVGQENKKYFLQNGLKNDQLVFAPHAVDNSRFSDPDGSYTQEANEWKKQLGVKEDELVLLYAGKLEPVKNLEWLVESVKGAPGLPIKLIMVGNGPLEEALRNKSMGDSRILFLNFQNQQKMPVVYRLGDVVVLCSHSETWGLATNEAMASGRAILVSDSVGCAKDLVKEGQNGFIFQTSDTTDFLDKIFQFLKDKKSAGNMGMKSALLIAGWNYENICQAIEQAVNYPAKEVNH